MPRKPHDEPDRDESPDDPEEVERLNLRYEFDIDRIERVYAWVAVNNVTGREGIIHYTIGGYKQPLLAVTVRQITVMKKFALAATRRLDVTAKCIEFATRAEVIIHEPPPKKKKQGRPPTLKE